MALLPSICARSGFGKVQGPGLGPGARRGKGPEGRGQAPGNGGPAGSKFPGWTEAEPGLEP